MDSELVKPAEQTEEEMSFWARHRYFVLIFSTIFVALALVGLSMWMYYSSGAVQLDLSRPGYSAVAQQVTDDENKFTVYPSTGPINTDSLNQFQQTYDDQAANAKAVDAFGGDPLSAAALGMPGN
jgi:hypothetical protein